MPQGFDRRQHENRADPFAAGHEAVIHRFIQGPKLGLLRLKKLFKDCFDMILFIVQIVDVYKRQVYGVNLHELALAIQKCTAGAVQDMADPKGLDISVTIEDLVLPPAD